MSTSLSVSHAATTLASSVNVYWGQAGMDNLGTVCQNDDSFDYITLGFIDISPENGGESGYPGNNFAGHCWASYYSHNGVQSQLLSECPYLTPGIKACQDLGKKVLLSIGGAYTSGSNYTVSSYEKGQEFGSFIWGAFGPYNQSWVDNGGPRPFDDGTTLNAVDGYDFDLESAESGNLGYQGMIETIRGAITASGRDDIITAAPQCPLDEYQNMDYLFQTVEFDRLWIQFYNNPQCEILDADGNYNDGFNYAEWETYLSTTPSRNAKLHIGLPGSPSAAGTGYVNASIANEVLCSCQTSQYSMFAGVMVWDQYYAGQNADESGIGYNQVLKDALKCGCGACPSPSSSSSVIASTSTVATSSSISSTATSTVSTTSSSISSSSSSESTFSASTGFTSTTSYSSAVSSSSSAVSSSSSGSSSIAISTSFTSTSVSTPAVSGSATRTGYPQSGSYRPAGPSGVSSRSSHPHFGSSSVTTLSSPTSSPVSVPSEISSSVTSTGSVSLSHRPHSHTRSHSWGNGTFTSAVSSPAASSGVALSSDGSGSGSTGSSAASLPITSTSSAEAVGTDVCSDDETATETGTSFVSSPAGASPTTTTTDSVSFSTSTVFSASIFTVTSCAASVTDCPARLTTSSFPVSTTIVPVTKSDSTTTDAPVTKVIDTTTSLSSAPTESFTTSTIYATTVVTVTSCAPSVTDCPARVTTSSFAVSTTILPVSKPAATTTEQLTTSTVFSATVYTITSCAATVTDCPARVGSVTTEVVALYTTVCPVTEVEGGKTSTAAAAAETGSNVESGSSGSGASSGSSAGSSSGSSSNSSSGSSSGSSDTSSGPSSSSSSSSDSESESGSESGSSGESGSGSSDDSATSINVAIAPEKIGEKTSVTAATLTQTQQFFSTVTVAVPASLVATGSDGHYSASGYGNGTSPQTKTYGLVKVDATGVPPSPASSSPSFSFPSSTPIITAGAGQKSVVGFGMAAVVGAAALLML